MLVIVVALLAVVCSRMPALAFTIELDDAAPDRVERQWAQALGQLPLPGTPAIHKRDERLAERGMKLGDPVLIRIFKAESELEVWVRKGERFEHFATYPICYWSGSLGPKLVEGDHQTPEGFYRITRRQLHWVGRWPRSLNLGFPNAFDRSLNRTGSYILVHGGCSSVGCYAMTNGVVAEVFLLVEKALRSGQEAVQVHAFPFRMTSANLERHSDSPWQGFWVGLKEGYDAFERDRVEPNVAYCEKGYVISAARPGPAGRSRIWPQRNCEPPAATAGGVVPSEAELSDPEGALRQGAGEASGGRRTGSRAARRPDGAAGGGQVSFPANGG